MKRKQIQEFQTILENREQELNGLIAAVEQNFRESIREESDDSQIDFNHPADLITEDPDYRKKLEIIRRQRVELKFVEDALGAIHEGSYGDCQSCLAHIDLKRLEAMPYTKYCIDCQQDKENQQKNYARIA